MKGTNDWSEHAISLSYATNMRRRFSVEPDGKTAHERNVGRGAVPSLAQFGERVWWMPLQPSNRRLGPLDSRFKRGYLGPMDGLNQCLLALRSGQPGERLHLEEAQGSRCLGIRAAQSGSERLCCNHMRQFLYLHWCPNFHECGEQHCAEPTSSSLLHRQLP